MNRTCALAPWERPSSPLLRSVAVCHALLGLVVAAVCGRHGGAGPTPMPAELRQRKVKHDIHSVRHTHFRRDNPSVLCDLERMPNFRTIIRNNGTQGTNHQAVNF